jgi:sporulation protein YlmC with PRC-barrel domain
MLNTRSRGGFAVAVLSLAVFCVAPTQAQTPGEVPEPQYREWAPLRDVPRARGLDAPAEEVRVDRMIGLDAEGVDGETLGSVQDVVLDLSGRARYLVLQHGGVLGVGGELFAVPWELAQPRPVINGLAERVLVQVDAPSLQAAPPIDRRQYDRDIAQVQWQSIDGYWAAWTPPAVERPRPVPSPGEDLPAPGHLRGGVGTP